MVSDYCDACLATVLTKTNRCPSLVTSYFGSHGISSGKLPLVPGTRNKRFGSLCVKVPFVSAVVDLEGGGTVKGNLVDIEPDPARITFDMPVEVVYRDAGRTDAEGNRYVAHFFVPAGRS